jgi:UrcA family protein
MRVSLNSRWLTLGAAAAGLTLAGAPALSQTVGELTVTGRMGDLPVISAAVSYRDLDLATKAGQDELRMRVSNTANDLCDRLGEGTAGGMEAGIPTCRTDAMNNARDQIRMAIASASPGAPVNEMAVAAPSPAPTAPAAGAYGAEASYTTSTVTNGPVPDTRENRAKYGQPMSHAGKRTAPAGN